MSTPEALVKDTKTARLRGLAGGSLVACKVSASPKDDPEDSSPIFGPKDNMDILGSYARMDSTSFGILAGRIPLQAISALHQRDEEAVSRELSNKKRS